MKFDYFETEWKDCRDWILNAEREVQNLWKNEYHQFPLREGISRQPTIPTTSLAYIVSPEPPAQSQLAVPDLVDLPSWKKNKRARIAADNLDVYDRYIQKEVEDELPAGPLQYWLDRTSNRHLEKLARMGVEIFSIPAMSADPERLFSRYKPPFLQLFIIPILIYRLSYLVQNCSFLIAATV
jgi:hypothetical protein